MSTTIDEARKWWDDEEIGAQYEDSMPKVLAAFHEHMESKRWIPVSERLPEASPSHKNPKYVLVHNGHHTGVGFRVDREDGDEPIWADETGPYITPEPTHWMPLPPSPPTT